MEKTSSRDYLNGLRVHLPPFLVWLAAVVVVIILFAHRASRYEVAGVAQGRVCQIAATCTGRLESVAVQLFDKVSKGQVIAVVNGVLPDEPTTTELEAQLDALDASIAQVVAESKAARDQYAADVNSLKTEWAADGRSFATDISDNELRALELTTEIETDRALLDELDVAVKKFIVEGRLDVNDAAVYELQLLRAQQSTIKKRIEYNNHAREQLQREAKAMLARELEFKHKYEPRLGTSDQDAEEVRVKQTQALERQKDVILAQLASLAKRQSLELRSPIDGVIIPIPGNSNEVGLRRPGENLLRRAGEVVGPGEPIFAVAQAEPRDIVAYVNERQLARVQEGMTVELIKKSTPQQRAKSSVTYVSPVVELMPERLWRNPAAPQWGRAVLIRIPPGLTVVSGELVGIRGLW
jgi:multidrug resistance efflux pump